MTELQPTPEIAPLKVSAVIFSYNHAAALRRSIEALEKSVPREALEILVVDAASDDESPTLDAQFPDTKFLRLERHFGATKALNIGFRTALGDYILLLDPEIEVQPATVAALAAHLDTDPDAHAVCPLILDPSGKPANEIYKLPDADGLKQFLKGNPPAPLSIDLAQPVIDVPYAGRRALMVRKSFLRNMNYLDERYGQFWGDADLCAQIRRAGKKIRLLTNVAVKLGEPPAADPQFRSALAADMAVGAAEYVGKYQGFGAGLGFRLSAIFGALGKLLAFQEPGFAFGRFTAILMGQKIDGSQ